MNQILKKTFEKKKGEKYDVAVMYSGGKDSSYLLYLLKEVYGLNVIAVMVDNGFEHEKVWKTMKSFTTSLGVPLKIIKSDKFLFLYFYKLMIQKYETFKIDGCNHLCFYCNTLLWTCVAKYAYENNIPYVASGLSLVQLNSGRKKPLVIDEYTNQVVEKSTKVMLQKLKSKMSEPELNVEKSICESLESFTCAVKNVITVYPYIYHNISLEDQKKILDEMHWEPPTKTDKEEYISSGCKIMGEVIYELEKLDIITLNERMQTKQMIEMGQISSKFEDYVNLDVSSDKVKIDGEVIRRLGIKQFLLEKCLTLGKTYING